MKYDQIEEFTDEQFRRLTGVKRRTFKKMIEILSEADHKKKTRGGRKSKLSIENRSYIFKINRYKIRAFGEFWSPLRKRWCFKNHKWHPLDFFVT
jgi:hypothetical protein